MEFFAKIFQPADFIGICLVLFMGLIYLWQWAGRPRHKKGHQKAEGDVDKNSGVS